MLKIYRPSNWETFDKDMNCFKIFIEYGTNLKVTYKDNDQIGSLLVVFHALYFSWIL